MHHNEIIQYALFYSGTLLYVVYEHVCVCMSVYACVFCVFVSVCICVYICVCMCVWLRIFMCMCVPLIVAHRVSSVIILKSHPCWDF